MGAFTYPRSEPGSAGHMDLVERLHANALELQRDLAGITDEAAGARPADDEWSIKQVTGHLCDYARHLHERLYKIIKLEEPRLPYWDQDEEWAKRDPNAARIDDLVRELVAQRGQTVELLTDLVHWNWARCGRHETLGRISIRMLVDRALAHDEQHMATIRSLVAGR
jgi:hypothetical protein